MMRHMPILVALAMVAPAGLTAQTPDIRAHLEARGLPASLVDDVVTLTDQVSGHGVPAEPLADKAIEGWAKHVPAARISAALHDFAGRLERARTAIRASGMTEPSGVIIAAAAEALGRGMSDAQVGDVVAAAREADVIGPALAAAMALAAQGMERDVAVQIVLDAERHGRSVSDILDIPSLARVMQMQGFGPAAIGEHMLKGSGATGPSGAARGPGMGSRPSDVPPGKGSGHRGPPGGL